MRKAPWYRWPALAFNALVIWFIFTQMTQYSFVEQALAAVIAVFLFLYQAFMIFLDIFNGD